MPCKALNAAGEPCRAAEHLLDDDGLCPAHRDGGVERMAELGRKGGEAAAKRFGEHGHGVADLPELRTPEDAERWAEIAGRAVAEGRLTHAEGRTIASLLREWRAAHADGRMRHRIEQVAEQVAELKGRGLKAV